MLRKDGDAQRKKRLQSAAKVVRLRMNTRFWRIARWNRKNAWRIFMMAVGSGRESNAGSGRVQVASLEEFHTTKSCAFETRGGGFGRGDERLHAGGRRGVAKKRGFRQAAGTREADFHHDTYSPAGFIHERRLVLMENWWHGKIMCRDVWRGASQSLLGKYSGNDSRGRLCRIFILGGP